MAGAKLKIFERIADSSILELLDRGILYLQNNLRKWDFSYLTVSAINRSK